jgi:hypothetical protein
VVSVHHHLSFNELHSLDTGFNYTWRAHAVHWAEAIATGKWEVWGYHYLYEYNAKIPFDTTYADTCNIIEGW